LAAKNFIRLLLETRSSFALQYVRIAPFCEDFLPRIARITRMEAGRSEEFSYPCDPWNPWFESFGCGSAAVRLLRLFAAD
jgi:hypothetical protein